MKPSIKYRVIYRYIDKYSVNFMCNFFYVSRSGYYDYIKRMDNPDKDKAIVELIRKCQKQTKNTYEYRRVKLWLLSETTPSMSRAETPFDNACAENFFSTLKTECIYR